MGQIQADTIRANELYSRAEKTMSAANADSAIHEASTALPLYERHHQWSKVADCYNLISNGYFLLAKYDQSLNTARKIIKLGPDKLDPNREQSALALQNMGRAYLYLSTYDSSRSAYEKALPLYEKLFSENDPKLGEFYWNYSWVYFQELDYERAIQYRLKTLRIYEHAYGPTHPDATRMHNDIAGAYVMAEEFGPAIEHLNKVIEIQKKQKGKNNQVLAYAYNRMGVVLTFSNNSKAALPYFFQAESLRDKTNIPFSIMNQRDMGEAYDNVGQYQLAIDCQNRALAIAKPILGDRHPAVVSMYSRLASVYQHQGLHDLALVNVQQALIADTKHFADVNPYSSPLALEIIDRSEGIQLLIKKAEVLREKFDAQKNIDDLKASLRTYELLDTLLYVSKLSKLTLSDKVRLAQYNTTVYEGAILECLGLHRLTKDDQFRKQAFYFSERNKSMILAELMNEAVINRSGIVPQEVIVSEQKLQGEIAEMKSRIERAKSSTKSGDLSLSDLENELFKLDLKSDSIRKKIENGYPQYSKLRQSNIPVSLEILQKQIPAGTGIIEYFEGNENIYAFLVTKDQFEIQSISRGATYDTLLKQFHAAVNPSTIEAMHSEAGYHQFVNSSHALYTLLLHDLLQSTQRDKSISKLVVIADGKLSYVPFEILLAESPSGSSGNYAALHYLLKDYSVSYGYSSTLLFRSSSSEPHNGKGLLSFAPDYKNLAAKTSAPALAQFRDAGELKWNQQEVEKIKQVAGGKYYAKEEATEAHFKQLATESKIIHLAMHALADDSDPMNSRLLFSQVDDPSEDGMLYAFELYSMKLNAQLVVLSACNTGYGKLTDGEGIMSLGRAFSYAGVPSVVISHWKVDDEVTSILMEGFYKGLTDGSPKSEALRDAKLSYLSSAEPAKAHPFYWAAFVSVGDDSPVEMGNNFAWRVMALGSAIVFGAFVIWRIRRRKSSTITHVQASDE